MEVESPEKETEYKTVFNEDGSLKFVKKEEAEKGKKNKSAGVQFEARVRKDLEEKGWVVDKWSNNFDLVEGRLVPTKRKMIPLRHGGAGVKGNPWIRMVSTIGTGFPDFMAFQLMGENSYKIIGVEVKINGTLSKEEKEKCAVLLEKKIFSEIWVARKTKNGRNVSVEYTDVKEILERMRNG